MKRLLFGIGVVLLVILILGFIAPKEFSVQRDIDINAPKGLVYESYLNSLEHLYSWATFIEEFDSVRFDGKPGTVGSLSIWEGGRYSGSEEIASVLPVHRVEAELRFIEPWESVNKRNFLINGAGERSRVTIRYDGHHPFPFNIRLLFTDMNKVMGPDLEVDLMKLKHMVETDYVRSRYEITVDSVANHCYVLVDTLLMSQPSPFDSDLDTVDSMRLKLVKERESGYELLFLSSDDSDTGNYYIVNACSGQTGDEVNMFQPDGRVVLQAIHRGSPVTRDRTYKVLESYIKDGKWRSYGHIQESYFTGDDIKTDTSNWLTVIRISITEE